MHVYCYSTALEYLRGGVCLEDVFLSGDWPFVRHAPYCRLVVTEDPHVRDVLVFRDVGGDISGFHDAV